MADSNQEEDKGGSDVSAAEKKRRRITQACDYCRSKKIKCEGCVPCMNCKNHNVTCTYTVEKKQPVVRRGHKYIEQLEDRLANMETLLRNMASGRSQENERTVTRSNSNEPFSLSSSRFDQSSMRYAETNPTSNTDVTATPDGILTGDLDDDEDEDSGPEIVDTLSSKIGLFSITDNGHAKFIGSSSSFSLLGHTSKYARTMGLQNNTTFEDFHKKFGNSNIFADEDMTVDVVYELPDRQTIMKYVQAHVEQPFAISRVVHGPTFVGKVNDYLDGKLGEMPLTSPWLALFHIVIALGALQLKEPETSLKMFKNAYQYLRGQFWQYCDLTAVQAVLLMSYYLQNGRGTSLVHYVHSICVTQALSIALHRTVKLGNIEANPVIAESRKRCFWALYFSDKNMSMLLGRPSAIQDYDIDVEYPLELDDEFITETGIITPLPVSGPRGFRIQFKAVIDFSKICSEVYRRLYSAEAARNRTVKNIACAIGDLDSALIAWRQSLPFPVYPSEEFNSSVQLFKTNLGSAMFGIDEKWFRLTQIYLHLTYFNCVCAIHRPGLIELKLAAKEEEKSRKSRSSSPSSSSTKTGYFAEGEEPNPRVYASASICVNAARTALQFCQDFGVFDDVNTILLSYVSMCYFANTSELPNLRCWHLLSLS